MSNLIFLTNQLQNPNFQKQMHLPLHFICFGIVEGKMYKYFNNKNNFIIATDYINQPIKRWGNSVVYGGVFLCEDINFYIRILDAYHLCSLSTLLKNHDKDIFHRIKTQITPIHFKTLDELSRLKYTENNEKIEAQMYVANTNHPKINKRINDKKNSYRIIDGIDTKNFKQLFWEVSK